MAMFVGKPLPWIGGSQGREGEPPHKWAHISGELQTLMLIQCWLIVLELVEACKQVLRYSRRVEALKEELEGLSAEGAESDEDL